MNFSAASSSCFVVTPGRIFDSSSRWVRTRMSPAAAIRSISAGDFLTITSSDLVFETERRDRRSEVVVHLRRIARAVEALQHAAILVVADDRLRLLMVDP